MAMANGSKKMTVLDVARHAGVSQGSVSRVLTGKNWVSDAVRARVEAAVRELGYVPNAMAQGLKAQRTSTIAAVVSDMSNPLHAEFLVAAEEQLRSAGYLMVVASTHNRVDQEHALLSLFRAGRADGLIVAHGDETRAETIAALKESGLPIVFHDRNQPAIGDAVLADHRSGAYAATQHLIELGHRRIALLTPPASIWPGRERLAGYLAALKDAGIEREPRLVRALDASTDMAFSEVKALLSGKARPTAIITLGTRMLAGVLTAIDSCAMSLPRDVSVVGIGDTDLLRLHTPPITSVRWDIAQCGRLAAELLVERLERTVGDALPFRARHVPVEFVLRKSTAKPPRLKP